MEVRRTVQHVLVGPAGAPPGGPGFEWKACEDCEQSSLTYFYEAKTISWTFERIPEWAPHHPSLDDFCNAPFVRPGEGGPGSAP